MEKNDVLIFVVVGFVLTVLILSITGFNIYNKYADTQLKIVSMQCVKK